MSIPENAGLPHCKIKENQYFSSLHDLASNWYIQDPKVMLPILGRTAVLLSWQNLGGKEGSLCAKVAPWLGRGGPIGRQGWPL